jgi:allophanate hydrolase
MAWDVQGTNRYTSMCTNLDPRPVSLLTLPDWQVTYAEGRPLKALLDRFAAERHDDTDDSVWIRRASAAQLQERIAELEARAATFADRAAALRAMPLFGVPFAVKDNIDVAGWPTTAACPAFAYTATADARAVQSLHAAGAVCVGKTNLDQFATGLVGTRSPYGRPATPFSPDHVSGGSSSGSAVAVARGEVPFALGTDTAGSGRVPAGFCNVVGLKPTPGRVGTSGVVPACRSLDCVAIFALTVDDAASVLAVIEGDDPGDDYSDFDPRSMAWPARLRIGVPAAPTLDDGYLAAWQRALAQVQSLGQAVVPLDFAPLHRTAELLYGGPWVAERHAAVQPLFERAPQAFDETVRQVIEGALRFSATDAFRGQYTLRAARRESAALWERVDVLMVPTAPGHPSFDAVDADPIGANARLGLYTNFVNLLGWCALAVPAGFAAQGLPFGVTFIARGQADAALAALGRHWQHAVPTTLGASGVTLRTQGIALRPAVEPTLPIAVVGAHLSGLPLNAQLTERGATLREATHTAPQYRLYALPGTTPPKPGVLRVAQGGAALAIEVWDVPLRHVGSFLALIPSPLGLGSVELADGRRVHGFLCEAHAVERALDITSFGGWRAYVQQQAAPPPPQPRTGTLP